VALPPIGGLGRLLSTTLPGGDRDPICLVCHRPVRSAQPRLRFQGDAYVHRACATYRMRRLRSGTSRMGYPR
jgi:hypothetical protein